MIVETAQNSLTIFYTDDDLDDLELFRITVQNINLNHKVFTFSKGSDLLDALNSHTPQPYILFLDINMPVMNGFEILETIRKSDAHSKLPIVMLSTSMDRFFIKRTQELGANYYLPKPPTISKMMEAIQFTLRKNWKEFDSNSDDFFHKDSAEFY